jgi:hypothetical protein
MTCAPLDRVTAPRFRPQAGRRALPLMALLASAFIAGAADKTNIVHHPPANSLVPGMMAARAREQNEAIAQSGVYRAFRFSDRAAESGITFEHRSVEDALKTWKPAHYDHGTGVAIADVDGDGRSDIYFVNQLGANQLWANLGGGKFRNITAAAGVGLPGSIHVAAAFADIDNDGDPDLCVTTVNQGNVLLENIGGRFRDITREAGIKERGHSSGAVFFDYDRDGLLDLFICNVGVYTRSDKGPGGFNRAAVRAFYGHLYPTRTETSLLYRNLGARRFREVSAEMGVAQTGWSGDATFTDLNGDGFPDLYVVNMQGDDHFFENDGGRRFVDRTAAYFPKTPWGAMGLKFFDFNLDGALDLFVTDMHSDMTDPQTFAGRVTMRRTFEKVKSESWCTTTWNDAFLQGGSNNVFGNAFYVNRGRGRFEELSDRLAVETYWPWGPSAADLNADGYEDLFVTAGMGWPFRYAINSVLLNDRGKRFFDAEFVLGIEPRLGGRIDRPMFMLDCEHDAERHELCDRFGPKALVHGSLSSRSSVVFDLDDDGDLDIVSNEMNDRPMILASDLSARKRIRFLKVKLTGSRSNRDGLGATVRVRTDALTLTRFHEGKSGYLSQSSGPLYFGLGEAQAARSVEITWPSGARQLLTNGIPENGLLVCVEP